MSGFESWKVAELRTEAERLGLTIEGSGANGRPLKGDYVKALNMHSQTKKVSPRKKSPERAAMKVYTVEELFIPHRDPWDYSSYIWTFRTREAAKLRVKEIIDRRLKHLREELGEESEAYLEVKEKAEQSYQEIDENYKYIRIYVWYVDSTDNIVEITLRENTLE